MKNKLTIIILGTLLVLNLTIYPQNASSPLINLEKSLEKMELYIERHPVADVKAVFDFFIHLITAPTSAKNCKDGIYKGESIYDDFHYKHVISLEIKNEKITAVKYDEVKKDGKGKKDNKKYCTEMKKNTGASPAGTYPLYQKQLIDRQDLKEVDAVSGATYSLYRFRSAAIRALLKAKKE